MKLLRVFYPLAFYQLCTVTLASATPAQPISILTANATADQLQAYNNTSTGPSNFLPNAPYYQPIAGTEISIKLFAFGPSIPHFPMDLIYAKAVTDAVNIHHRSPIPMGPGVLYSWNTTIRDGGLGMYLAPGIRMTWQMWAWVCNGLMHFMIDFEYVELEFDVLFGPWGTIARGNVEVNV